MSNTSLGFLIRYLLDTNICIYVMNHKPPGVLALKFTLVSNNLREYA